MENQIVLCPTKVGNGFKIVVDGVWYYTSKNQLYRIFKGSGCVFTTIEDKQMKRGDEDGN